MAHRTSEDPALSPVTHLSAVDYPAWRENVVKATEDGGAPAEVINLLKSLPRGKYETKEEAIRDLSEASRRSAMGNHPPDDEGVNRDRRNLGKDAVEHAPAGKVRHP